MRVGYIRVSTQEQNTARQEVIMKELNVDKVFIDKATGKNTARTGLQKLLAFVRDGDVVVTESYSRIARNTKDLLNIVEELESKGVGFISTKENVDTNTPTGRLLLTIFAGLSQFERECLLSRQAEGIAIAKENGVYKGRKPIKVDEAKFKKLYIEWKDNKITAVHFYTTLGLSASTFYRKIAEYEGR